VGLAHELEGYGQGGIAQRAQGAIQDHGCPPDHGALIGWC